MNTLPTTQLKVFLLPDGQGENITIFLLGATGSGKTTLTANLLLDYERWLVFDIKQDFSPAFFAPKKVEIISTLPELANWLNNSTPQSAGIFIFPDAKVDPEEILNAALWQVYDFQKANKESGLPPIAIVLDELNRFVESASCPEGLKEIIERGRSYGIYKILGGQWFGSIPTWVRNSFSEIYVFRHVDPSGVTRLKAYGFDPDEVSTLPQYTCLHASGEGVRRIELVAANKQFLKSANA